MVVRAVRLLLLWNALILAGSTGLTCAAAFVVVAGGCGARHVHTSRVQLMRLGSRSSASASNTDGGRSNDRSSSSSRLFEVTIDLPPTGSDLQARLKIAPILSVPSELVQVRYKVPFALNVEPKRNLALCSKDGPGGERVNDVLRFTSQWTMGLPRGEGILTTAAAFSGGGLSWQCSMFDVMKAEKWEQVVQALLSNTQSRTDEVVLIFERPLEGYSAPELQ